MTEIATTEKNVVPPRPATEDLSKEMEQSMERQPDERIKIVRVFGNCYRCNWWVQDKTPQPYWLASGKIRKSALVRATKTSDGLLIEAVT
jgi:hypothetical protein